MQNTVSSLGPGGPPGGAYTTSQGGRGDTQGNPASIENSSVENSQLEAKLVDTTTQGGLSTKEHGQNVQKGDNADTTAIKSNSFTVA